MPQFTEQQNKYITNNIIEDTKLLACAGSGKTFGIICKIDYLIKSKMFLNTEILMLTFSRFTRDDFINKVKKYNITTINDKYVKTIDSFAKSLIDENNEIDVSLLSYKFMKYLEETSADDIKKNTKLSQTKCIFVDEAQDLNETQYKILVLLKEKNGTIINLIGDPNQNIYQFRNSSDKFLTEFNATTFYLTQNFRSHDPIIEFSKYLRPIPTMDIKGTLGKSNCIPNIIFHENDSELEMCLIKLLKNAKKVGLKYHDIAILSPTRGRMRGHGKSHGLCLISNLLYKNNIKFKQFYEETTDDLSNNIRYEVKKDHINVLTYMGSKGLEWKFVILVDADICLINKRYFTEQKHKNDQYLLYVACSRAIDNIIIFSKCRFSDGNLSFQLNPWFNLVPKQCYELDKRFKKHFKYPNVKTRTADDTEKRITKIIDRLDEKLLDELAQICNYGTTNKNINTKSVKLINKIFDKDFSIIINSNIFLGKYVENLFFIYYRLKNKMDKKKYVDIENIIDSKHIVTDIQSFVSDWFYMNRSHLSWEEFDKQKSMLDKTIVETIEKKFSRDQKLQEHTIVSDGYFKSFILSLKSKIKQNYNKYIKTNNTKKIRRYLFNIIVIIYSLETQHYFHAKTGGKKFKDVLTLCSELFDKIEEFAFNTKMNIIDNNVLISKDGLIGEIDMIEQNGINKIIWELKCVSDISLKHILQVLMYNLLYHDITETFFCSNDKVGSASIDTLNPTIELTNNNIIKNKTSEKDTIIDANFINFLKGEMITVKILLTFEQIARIKKIFMIGSSGSKQ